jgi:hypothetical protein
MDVVTFLAMSVNLVGGGVLWYWYLYGFYIWGCFFIGLHCRGSLPYPIKRNGPPVCLGEPDPGGLRF